MFNTHKRHKRFNPTNCPQLQLIVAFAAIVVVSAQIRPALVSSRDRDAVILKQTYEPNPDGSYVYKWVRITNAQTPKRMGLSCAGFLFCFSYETSNGIRADQQGYLKNPGSQVEAQVNYCKTRVYMLYADLHVCIRTFCKQTTHNTNVHHLISGKPRPSSVIGFVKSDVLWSVHCAQTNTRTHTRHIQTYTHIHAVTGARSYRL